MVQPIDRSSNKPLYLQLGEYLVSTIVNDPENRERVLLSEREMSCAYSVSRATVRQALNYVERQGYIRRVQGSGTYVAQTPLPQSLMKLYSFSQEMNKQGKTPSSQILSFSTYACPPGLRAHLGLEGEGRLICEFRRCRLADEIPTMYETTYLSCERFPDFTRELLENHSFYTLLREHYRIELDRAVQEFQVVSARREESKYLGVPEGSPMMLVERTGYYKGEIIEYSKGIIPAGMIKYRVELNG